jgi:acyl-CoA thioesterase FadM
MLLPLPLTRENPVHEDPLLNRPIRPPPATPRGRWGTNPCPNRIISTKWTPWGVMVVLATICRLDRRGPARIWRARYGLSYDDFRQAGVMAPVKRMDIDYTNSRLRGGGGKCGFVARMPVETKSLRIDTECAIYKQDGQVAATGAYRAQLLVEAPSMALILVNAVSTARSANVGGKGEFSEC